MLKDAKTIAMVYNVFKKDSAVIAGGCLRDIDTGREPKDIDILIEYESDADYREASMLANRLGYKLKENNTYGPEGENQLRFVIKMVHETKKPIDLIFLNCPVQERIDNFPCNASQVWLYKGTVCSTEEYDQFLITNKLEFYKSATKEYKERMLNYYPQRINHEPM